MKDLDVLAAEHLDRLDVPAGAGADAVMERGRRRRTRRRAVAGLSSAAVAAVVAIGLMLVAARTDGGEDQSVAIESADTTAASGGSGGTTADAAVTIDTSLLPARDSSLLPTVPTPVLEGWTIDVTAVELSDRFTDAGQTVRYRLRASGSELHMTVVSGQVTLTGDRVTVERQAGPVDGSVRTTGGGTRELAWNERPGVNTGTGVRLVGPAAGQLLEVASMIEFVDLPLTGASEPTFVDLDPERTTVFSGTVDGVDWRVAEHDDGETSIEIDGRSPSIAGELARPSPTAAAIDTTTVSYEGHQITAVVAPAHTASVSFGLADGTRIPLPLTTSDSTGRRIAVSVVPADRDAAAIVVTQTDGTETVVGLPVAPGDGWTTSKQSFGSN